MLDAWCRLCTDATRYLRRLAPSSIGCLAAIVALGVVLRVQNLNQPMRFDEAYTYLYFASQSWTRIVSDYSLPNNHILHSLLVHFCVRLWGNAPAVIRLPSLLAGIAVIPATYAAGRCFVDEPSALLAAGLVSTSTALTLYATDARGYSLVCLCFLALLVLAQYIAHSRNIAAWTLFVLFAVIGLYTIPIMI